MVRLKLFAKLSTIISAFLLVIPSTSLAQDSCRRAGFDGNTPIFYLDKACVKARKAAAARKRAARARKTAAQRRARQRARTKARQEAQKKQAQRQQEQKETRPAKKRHAQPAPPARTEKRASTKIKVDPKIRDIQRMLTRRGYAPGPVDGKMGRKTRSAILKYYRTRSLKRRGSDTIIDTVHADLQGKKIARNSLPKKPEKKADAGASTTNTSTANNWATQVIRENSRQETRSSKKTTSIAAHETTATKTTPVDLNSNHAYHNSNASAKKSRMASLGNTKQDSVPRGNTVKRTIHSAPQASPRKRLPNKRLQSIQGKLQAKGYNVGKTDGLMSTQTRSALTAYKIRHRLKGNRTTVDMVQTHLDQNSTLGKKAKTANIKTARLTSPITPVMPVTKPREKKASPKATPVTKAPTKLQIIHRKLKSAGYRVGPLDNKIEPDTRSAIRAYAIRNGIYSGSGSILNRVYDHMIGKRIPRPVKTVTTGHKAPVAQKSQSNTRSKSSKPPVFTKVLQIQKLLNAVGYNVGKPDGTLNSKSRTAIVKYFKLRNLHSGRGTVLDKVLQDLRKLNGQSG